ncbi:hypothetical protein GCM10022243_49130 [Saccharothrix violaceirubra]|uniref:Uncharacterized protein n=1 Tax=Saccharothrix violaceirubra TaxID=413306 RepID=A0A7W7SZC1_9PSEU|nr:hypothetical protein [Saccharothrix violaceirubra]MBB4963744.1 hypothetical protein [Saccharothrix violaceirubra]
MTRQSWFARLLLGPLDGQDGPDPDCPRGGEPHPDVSDHDTTTDPEEAR